MVDFVRLLGVPSKLESATFVAQKAFQRIQVLPRVNNVSAFSGVVTVLTGFPEVDDESFLWEDLHF